MLPPSTTAAAVSSHEVSMPRIRTVLSLMGRTLQRAGAAFRLRSCWVEPIGPGSSALMTCSRDVEMKRAPLAHPKPDSAQAICEEDKLKLVLL